MNDATLVTVAGRDPRAPARRGQSAGLPCIDHPVPDGGGHGSRAAAPGHHLRPLRHADHLRRSRRPSPRSRAATGRSWWAPARRPSPRCCWRCCARGDHLLVVDTVYAPTRHFCTGTLARFGIETTFYDPLLGAGIAELIRPETRAGVHREPGLAHLRDAGHAGDRRGGARQRLPGRDGQHLGLALVLQALPSWVWTSRFRR